jgi:RNA polymerase sigma-70 factor (ECF subfamily)
MGSNITPRGLDVYAVRLIQHKAQQLVGNYGFVKDDRPDIEQDLIVDLLARLPIYDPSRAAPHTFMARVIEHKIASLIEERTAAKRDYRRCTISLNDPVADDEDDGEERGDGVDMDSYLRMTGGQSMSVADQAACHVDLARAMKRLSPAQRALCARLAAGQERADIARELGVHRDTVHERIKEIRAIFVKAGLKK